VLAAMLYLARSAADLAVGTLLPARA
jgi:hypothetical protein